MKFNKVQMIAIGGVFLLILAFAVNGFAGAASNPTPTVGYVDNDKITNALPEYTNFQNNIKDKQSQFNQYESTLAQQHNTYVKDLENKATQEKAGKSAAEQTAIDKKYGDMARKKTNEMKGQLDQKRNEMMKALNDQKKVIDAKILKIIANVATQKKLTTVLDKKVIYFGGTDITDTVIDNAKKDPKKNK